jgi:aminoglycoside 2'-N-acetyltransferase I
MGEEGRAALWSIGNDGGVTRLLTIPTSELSGGERAGLRQMLNRAFLGSFDDDDWDHALGGLHVVVTDRHKPIGHAAVVQRQFQHRGRAWRCGYVEAVAVDPSWRGQGFGAAIMAEAERLIDHGYDLGALSASTVARGLYAARGWLPWQGPTWALSPTGPLRTEDEDDSTFVRVVAGGADLSLTDALTCDWRNGDVW